MTAKRVLDWRTLALIGSLLLSVLALGAGCTALWHTAPAPGAIDAFGVEKFYRNVYFRGDVEIADDLTVAGETDLGGALELGDIVTVTGDLTVEGDSDLYGDISSSEGAITMTDLVHITGARDATTGYDYYLTVEGDLDGTLNGAKTYGQYIEVERPVDDPVAHGNIDDAGLKVRAETNAITTVVGYVLNGADIQAKTDNNAQQPTLRGAQITADTDEGSKTDTAHGLRVYVEGEGVITSSMQIADFELSRQQATDPTAEYGLNIRNTSRAGGGADVALRIESSYGAGGSATDDDWEYLIDLEPADATVADIRLSNGETITNTVDGIVRVSGNTEISGTLDVASNLDVTGALDVQGGNITLQNDETIANSLDGVITLTATTVQADADVEVTGALDVQGGDITLQNDATISNDVSGIITFTVTTLTADADVEVTGALDVQGGNITLQNDETIANSLNGVITFTTTTAAFTGGLDVATASDFAGDVTLSGGANLVGPQLDMTFVGDGTQALTNDMSGSWWSDFGASVEITFTLPTDGEGSWYCIYNMTGITITIQPTDGGAAMIRRLTNCTGGERIQSTTADDMICLFGANNDTQWFPYSVYGTWADID